MFPIRNLRAAHWKASKENYPDRLGITVWTAVKGDRPQVIEFVILKTIIAELDKLKLDPNQTNIRIKITHSTAGLVEIKIGAGGSGATIRLTLK